MKKPESKYIQGLCTICGKNKQHTMGKCKKTGQKLYKCRCYSCSCRKQGKSPYRKFKKDGTLKFKKRYSYRVFKKQKCEVCGFIPINKCQLDVDHKDGNHSNNEKYNLQTLCANCHRLKTFFNNDGLYSNKAQYLK